jgi:soluble lytic murein transglycosylase
MPKRPGIAAAFLVLLLCAHPACAALGRAPGPDDLFLAARDAAKAGDKAQLARLLPKLSGHPLAPYVEAWNLRLRFAELSPDVVSAWLDTERGNYLADRVRAEWLRWLAQNQQWERFDAEYPKLLNEDAEATCFAFTSRMRVNAAAAIEEARPFVLAAKELPEGCMPVLQVLREQGAITEDQVWLRIRLAFQSGSLRYGKRLAEFLPAREIPDSKAIDRIASKPRAWLDKPPPSLAGRAARELTLFALYRLARGDPQQAAAFWDRKLCDRFPPADQAYGWALLGYQAARHHDPDAVKWYREAGSLALSDEQAAWKARAALRAGNWHVLLDAVAGMSTALAAEPAWIYWRGRALKAIGGTAEANALFGRIAGEFHFYGQLAAEELGAPQAVPPRASAATAADIAGVEELAAVRRAILLFRLGMRFEAIREWQWAMRGMDDTQLLAAAQLANREQLYDRAINAADKTRLLHDFTLRYLMPFDGVLAEQTRSLGLDLPWVYGLIRQESRFIFDAKSAVGARGLMQLMPATAKWVAKRIGMGDHHLRDITRSDINIVLGTNYLKHVLDDLGSPVLASAAYNAGPGRARRWRDAQPLEGAIYAETIPFNETRDYVKKVMSNAAWYASLLSGRPESLKSRLGSIGPRVNGEKFNEELP